MTCRVFLVDDHEVVRTGLRALLEVEDDIEIAGEAATAAEALARIPATRPDVVLLDVRLPDASGVEVCREVRSRHPEIACVMLTSYADDEAMAASLLAGAAGYLLKQVHGHDLVEDVRRVAAGESLVDPVLAKRAADRLRAHSDDAQPAGLTAQERRILDLIAQGLTNRQIGEALHLAEKTVKNYVSALLSKLGMERRTQAAALAVRMKERAALASERDRTGT
ncbi:MAG: response regulator transcription factor [Actinomycetota bacterium]|nr:response regulator transcription factor [Actinomycetota bacterium]